MPAGSSKKRERQYEHIKEGYEKRGQKGRAEEIAARTVNKERAEAGETKGSRKGGKSSSSSKPKASSGRSSSSSSKPKASSGKSSSSSSSRKSSSVSSRPSANSGKSSSSSSRKSSGSSSRASASSGKSSSSSSSSRSSSKPSARGGNERTKEQLYKEARKRGVEGRSTMNKAQLERALSR